MNKNNFSRRQFITSMAMGTVGLMLIDPFSSFGNISKQLNSFQKSGLLFYKDSNGKIKPVTTIAEWKTKQKQILDGMQQAMGKLPEFSNLPAMNIQIIDELKEENYTRQTISFTVAENEKVPAYLYVPIKKNKKEKLPAMLALHETEPIGGESVDGEGHNINLAYAKELAQRGYVVIAPDYPSFGDLKDYDFSTDRYQSGMMKSIFDNMRCVDLLQARPDVDAARIGVIGHSLGGHTAIFTGAFDKRLKVVVSSCGWTLFSYYDSGEAAAKKYGGALGPWAQDRYMPLLRDKYNLDIKKIPFDFDEAIAAIASRAFFSNSPLNDSNFSADGVRKELRKFQRYIVSSIQRINWKFVTPNHNMIFQQRFVLKHIALLIKY